MVTRHHFFTTGRQPNLAGCREKVGGCLVSSDGNLDCQAVWHVDTRQHVCGTAGAVPHTALRGRHGVDAGQHIQPLWGERGIEGKKGGVKEDKKGRGQAALDGGESEQKRGRRRQTENREGGAGERERQTCRATAHKSIQFH